jgi:hypothetical protein
MSESKNIGRRIAIESERVNFKTLLVSNPNYFGNLSNSSFKAVKKIIGNTTYEELKCVGLYPEFDLLEAIVYIKREAGYGGDICSTGTSEYVRFYLSYDNGATWEDQGSTSFKAQDIPGPKPLEYAVQLQIKPKKKFCTTPNLPLVRAILSWNAEPPADTPDFAPVWGNVVNDQVQIDPFKFIIKQPISAVLQDTALVSLLKENNLIAPELTMAETKALDLDELKKEVAEGIAKMSDDNKELAPVELQKLYAGQKVNADRYLFPAVTKLAASPTALKAEAPMLAKAGVFAGLDINISDIIGNILKTDGNTSYEEMGCVGLNTMTSNLEATIKVKKGFGYLGTLCKKGSREYVAFWMDFGSGWEYVGTTSVRVHDISSMPAGGLNYAVTLPVNLNDHRRPCSEGPKTVPVRAILSWETPPNPAQPDQIPTYGNREETLVLITPGDAVNPGTHPAFIETVGGMSVDDINSSGYASGAAVTAGFTANESPFGGEIVIAGHLAYPTDISTGATPLEYRLRVNDGTGWQTVSNSFGIHRTQLLDGIWSTLPTTTQSAPGGWYTYREDLSAGPGNAQIFVSGNILARWQTNATMDTEWQIRIESRVAGTVAPTWISAPVTVRVDNVDPAVTITSPLVCNDVDSGDPIDGTYSAFDDHFGSYRFEIIPANGGTFTVNPSGGGSFSSPSPLSRSYPAVSGTGESGAWELDTTGIPQCGYVIYLHAWDRTIVNSGYVGHYGSAVMGVCIRGSS